jgi:hypothetical protein
MRDARMRAAPVRERAQPAQLLEEAEGRRKARPARLPRGRPPTDA